MREGERACDQCENPYTPRQREQKFCCRACKLDYWRDERREALRLARFMRDKFPDVLDTMRERMETQGL